jgi:hypothetical protein
MSALQINALKEFETILRKALPGAELPENLVDLLLAAMKDSERDRLNEFSFVKPKIDAILKSTLKETVKLLPFMPDRVDYMIDQGRCCMIEYDSGLFTPCCKVCVDGKKHCKGHIEKPAEFGEYEERLAIWNEGVGVGKMSVTVGDKTYSEVTYGEYLMAKKVAPEHVKKALKDAGIPLRLHPHDLQCREKTKKARGRPSEKKVEAVSLDGEELEEVEAEDTTPTLVDKPKRTKLTEEEKAAKKAQEEAEKAAKKEKREADRKSIAERKEAEAIVKAKEAAAKAAKKAEDAAEKAANAEKGIKPKPKAKNPVKPDLPLGTSLDASPDYNGDLDELTEAEHPETREKFWIDENHNIYNADRKCIGKVNEDGEPIFF